MSARVVTPNTFILTKGNCETLTVTHKPNGEPIGQKSVPWNSQSLNETMLFLVSLLGWACGDVVFFTLLAQESFLAPDGFLRKTRTFNGTIPGPELHVNIGDQVIVSVLNELPVATSVHWHGIDQVGQGVYSDGVPMLTQWPIAPGEKFVYNFTVRNAGTMWYHSHSGTQRVDGMAGALVVHDHKNDLYRGKYDSDYVVFLSDWYREWSDDLFELMVGSQHIFPTAITAITFNGKAQSNCSGISPDRCNPNRPLEVFDAPALGRSMRLRLISGTANSLLRFSIDGHNMTVIEADGSYLMPVTTHSLLIDGGQRYSVLVQALPDASRSYFLRAQRQSVHAPHPMSFAVLSYGNSSVLPSVPPPSDWGVFLRPEQLQMFDGSQPPPFSGKLIQLNLFDTQPSTQFWNWTINGALYSDPAVPFICSNSSNVWSDFEPSLKFVLGETYDVVWQNLNSLETHPIHHHGHKLWIISTGPDPWNTTTPEFPTPINRDTEILLGSGHIRYRFTASIPGMWALHCHVEWWGLFLFSHFVFTCTFR